MNKIFKVIWNHATQSWNVTSELCRAHGKTKSLKTAQTAIAAAVATMAMASGSAYAAMAVGGVAATSSGSVSVGTWTTATPTVTAGTATVTGAGKGMAIGEKATVNYTHNTNNGLTQNSVSMAIGNNATVDNAQKGMVIGSNSAVVGANAVVIGHNTAAIKNEAEGANGLVVIGNDALVRNVQAAGQSRGAVAIGANSLSGLLTNAGDPNGSPVNTTNSDYDTLTGELSAARLLYRAGITNATGSTVGGLTSNEATAIGFDSRAIGDQSIAIGAQVVAGHSSVALGGNDMGVVVTDINKGIYQGIVGKALADNNINDPSGKLDRNNNPVKWYETTYAKDGSVAIGQKAHSNELFGTAIGTSAFVEAGAQLGTAIGTGARVGKQKLQDSSNVTYVYDFTTKGGVAIAAGAVAEQDYTTAVGTGANALAQNATALGYKAFANGTNATAVGAQAKATAADALAYGGNATAYAANAVAVGTNSTVTAAGRSSIAFGTDTTVSGIESVALGSNIKSLSTKGSVVLGDHSSEVTTDANGNVVGASHKVETVSKAVVTSKDGTTITYGGFAGAVADEGKYVSVGAPKKTVKNDDGTTTTIAERQIKNVAAGNVSSTSTDAINGSQLYSVAQKFADQTINSTYFHVNNATQTQGAGDATTNLGNITDKAGATGQYAVTAGVNATANGTNGTAIGHGAVSTGSAVVVGASASAIGANSQNGANGAVAIGEKANVVAPTGSAPSSIAIGYNAYAEGKQIGNITTRTGETVVSGTATVVGSNAKAIEAGVAIGQAADAGLAQFATAIGADARALGDRSTAIGVSTRATGQQAAAMGWNANASGVASLALSTNTTASGDNSVAMSGMSSASGAQSMALGFFSNATGMNSIALGREAGATGVHAAALTSYAKANGHSSIAAGVSATTTADALRGVAIARESRVSATDGIAIGYKSNVSAERASALGANTVASHADAVALGSGSTTTTANPTTNGTIAGITYGTFAGTTPASVVSVGSAGSERQIVNVAAGRISSTSTDAINGSQLYYVAKQAAKPLTFTANSNQDTDAEFLDKQYAAKDGTQQQLGETISIIGAATAATGIARDTAAPTAGKYSAKNIQTVVTNGEVQIQMATNPVFNSTVIGGKFDADGNQVGSPIVIGTDSNGNNTISNLTTTLPVPSTANSGKSGTLPDNVNKTNAATLGDVLNAGWNLQENSQARDLVTPYNTVNFVNGKGTTVSITNTDGNLSTVKVDVNTSTLTGNITQNTNGTVTVPTSEGDKLANTSTVAEAINKSGWTAAVNKTGTGESTDKGGDKLVNPGDTVTIIAGDNMNITKEGLNYTIATKKDASFNSTTIGGATTKDADGNTVVNNPITISSTVEGDKIVNTISNLTTTLPDNTTNGTLPSNITTTTNAATLGDVLNAGWNLQGNGEAKDFVKPYDTVNFANGAGTIAKVETSENGTTSTIKFDVNVDGNTITINKDGQLVAKQPTTQVNGANVTGPVNIVNGNTTTVTNTPDGIKVEVNTTPLTNNENGKVNTPANPNAIATAGDVANAINNSGWTAAVDKTGTGESTDKGGDSLVNPGDTVKFIAGDNMNITKDGLNYTIATKKDVKFDTIAADKGLTIGSGDNVVNMTPTTTTVANGETKPAVDMNGATLTNISYNLPNTTSVGDKPTTNAPITAQEAQDLANKSGSNAATLGDVLNAGWNLQGNGIAKDFVKPYDTVNFVNGAGTTAEVTSNGQVSNVTYNVAVDDTTTEITYTDAKGNTLYKQADGTYNTARDGKGTTVKAGDVTGSRVSAKTSPLTTNADGTVNTPANPNSLATAGDVANAINNSGFTLTTSASKGEVEGTSNYKVNPGKKVTIDAGKNIKVTQKDGVVSVATKDDVEFNSVKAGPVTINQNGIDAGGKKITNVAKGTDPNDAVNVSQLKEVAGDIHNKINRNNKDLRAGIAGANAAAGLPQVYTPGRSMVAASAGAFKGQSAFAVGYSRASDNGKLILKLQGNANSRGDVGGSVGMGYQW